ncbi:MAG: DEAD/DEAH box helicase [Firmicutes bacterium]|nr:DEAD/DEAH box helicase [Bacillota bacterium]
MSRLKKLDFLHAKAIINEILSVDKSAMDLEKKERAYISDIQKNTESIIEDLCDNELKKMDIEHININKSGIRVSNLRAAGITNIYQARQSKYEKLVRMDGIGPQSANRIIDQASNIYLSTRDSIKFKFDPNSKGYYESKMLEALFILINGDSIFKEAAEINKKNHDKIAIRVGQASPALSKFKWFFTSKKNKAFILKCLDEIEVLLSDGYKDNVVELIHTLSDLENKAKKASWSEFESNASNYYAKYERICGTRYSSKVISGGLTADLISKIESYKLELGLFKSTLRKYQDFGTKYILCQKYVLLGDEMGLGKTVQSIAAMADLNAKGKSNFLVICPNSVLINWMHEIKLHSNFQYYKIHGSNRNHEFTKWKKQGGIAVSTYDTIGKLDLPIDFKIDMLIVDEAHFIKNPEAQRTKNLIQIANQADYKLFMTGTPIENKVNEMYFLIKTLNPFLADKIKDFKSQSNSTLFKEKIAPIYLRRIREDVLTELPSLEEIEEWCTFNDKEKRSYIEALETKNFMKVRQLSWHVNDIEHSNKAKRLVEICQDAYENNRKVIVFSFFLDVIDKVSRLVENRCVGVITGSISSQERQNRIDSFTAASHGAVLVCQITAGGIGLNIQAASVVIFCEPQLKPSIENQAISRAYRMGQTQKVIVHRLLMESSIDERIMDILGAKQLIFNNYAHESAIAEADKKFQSSTWITNIIEEERKKYA